MLTAPPPPVIPHVLVLALPPAPLAPRRRPLRDALAIVRGAPDAARTRTWKHVRAALDEHMPPASRAALAIYDDGKSDEGDACAMQVCLGVLLAEYVVVRLYVEGGGDADLRRGDDVGRGVDWVRAAYRVEAEVGAGMFDEVAERRSFLSFRKGGMESRKESFMSWMSSAGGSGEGSGDGSRDSGGQKKDPIAERMMAAKGWRDEEEDSFGGGRPSSRSLSSLSGGRKRSGVRREGGE